MIVFSGVTKAYAGHTALHALDLEIERGRTTVLLGTSGCGKSTILRLIAGLIRCDAGEVRVDGEPMTSANVDQLRRRIGYVIQDGGLFPHLTAARNVGIVADYLGWSRDRQTQRLEELAALVQLEPSILAQYPQRLSGGQRQRVGLMRALMLDPELLLLDEPLGALDPITRADLQADLKRIFAAAGRTVVLVTHDLGEAFYLADHIVLLRDGAIVQQGTRDDLLHRPAAPFVTRFINAQRIPGVDAPES